MKNSAIIILAMILFSSCKQELKAIDYKKEILNVSSNIYPEHISKIFEAHGGMDTWNTFKSLYFEIEKPNVNDTYDVSLNDRQSLITMTHHKLGYDGEQVWLKNLDTTQYKANAKFYYNLMFYFYAMPHVLGDDGINYADAPSLIVDGKEYPGILISYNDGIGESSGDEYIVYYDKETHKMSWLAYTVTFFSKEKSKKFKLIKYDQWETIEGVDLPSIIKWHQFEEGKVGDMRNEVRFVNARLSNEELNKEMFKVPDSTMIVK